MKYAFKEPGKDMIIKEVEKISLKLLQEEVEGYIELVYNPFSPQYEDSNLVLVCNDSGLIDNKVLSIILPDQTHIFGNFVLCYLPDDGDEDLRGLNANQLEYVKHIKDKIEPAMRQIMVKMMSESN